MSSAVRTIPSPSSDDRKYRFTLTEIKRMKRAAARQHSKLQRKVETMRKLRDETYDLNRKIGFLREEETRVAGLMYTPDPKSSDY